ncbi:MAG: hypothetical protein H6828_00135 [Planctomycetes bacterium]|nr:hypothetical protein [Planctomycetota bacterium]
MISLRSLLPALLLVGLGAAAPSAEDATVVQMVELNNVEYQIGDDLPDWVIALDGQRIEIAGFMRTGTLEGETWFDLTNDSCGCGTSKLQHFVRVTLESGTTSFTPDELTLTGTFAAGEQEDEDGFVESIYRLTITSL